MKIFNTSGPVNPEEYYYVPHRLNEANFMWLIDNKKYFILHAPRQSGKTTAIRMFVNALNAQGKYTALYINIEPAQIVRSDVEKGMKLILKIMADEAMLTLDPHNPLFEYIHTELKDVSGNSLKHILQKWSIVSDKPILLFIDEIDSLIGDTLISVLRQLRAGYPNRPKSFPQSVCLIGVRDVRDYRIWSQEENSMVLGGSAFNIKAESLTLPNFSLEQVRDLYHQHTQATGQQFTEEAIEYAYYLTQGQPWLVNALAFQACFKDVTDRNQPITKEVIDRAKETLILRRDTHIDQLLHKIQEPRVRYIIDAIISGTGEEKEFKTDDLQYVRDLGLMSQKGMKIANPIYQEIIPRELSYGKQESIVQEPIWYKNPDGSLNMHNLLEAFTQFYRENSEIWFEEITYKESGPHLLFMAFLQRIINGGGKIHREYALGRKRVDLLVEYNKQRIVIELKINRGPKSIVEALEQTAHYMDVNNATEGHLVMFDPAKNKLWDEKIFQKTEIVGKNTIEIWNM